MQRFMLRGKIHRATITEANVDYIGSVTIDSELMALADILENEKVSVVNLDNGVRLETYAIAGARGSGVICLNGAAALLMQPGEKVIILSYAIVSESEIAEWQPRVVLVDNDNKPVTAAKVLHPATSR
ncbi:MAG: aspartate 1-decarboxylase [Candidatus Aquicultor primus]|uniref:Aspartate 1-decarboxylase n=1 Tax=Candidatus Aquicultor primus TaxID=1797195 RepID=A0A1F2UFH4_9ACTN|nr:MAG: aspartate 1-decarboxylase [Candidatus Aquicultor primus]